MEVHRRLAARRKGAEAGADDGEHAVVTRRDRDRRELEDLDRRGDLAEEPRHPVASDAPAVPGRHGAVGGPVDVVGERCEDRLRLAAPVGVVQRSHRA